VPGLLAVGHALIIGGRQVLSPFFVGVVGGLGWPWARDGVLRLPRRVEGGAADAAQPAFAGARRQPSA
jgi:hypothetical protein